MRIGNTGVGNENNILLTKYHPTSQFDKKNMFDVNAIAKNGVAKIA